MLGMAKLIALSVKFIPNKERWKREEREFKIMIHASMRKATSGWWNTLRKLLYFFSQRERDSKGKIAIHIHPFRCIFFSCKNKLIIRRIFNYVSLRKDWAQKGPEYSVHGLVNVWLWACHWNPQFSVEKFSAIMRTSEDIHFLLILVNK